MGPLSNRRHERFAQALAQGKTATEAYIFAGYKANDGNASRMKGNERISAREFGRSSGALRSGPKLALSALELAAIGFSDISKAVTWGPRVEVREDEHGRPVKIITSAVSLVPTEKLDENTAAAIAAVSQSSTGALRIKMHNKLAALVALGRYLGMFDERPQNTNAVYAISDTPMTKDEWVRCYVTPH
jgi:phage terminase small subunit